jgi:hypothetical protein
VGTVAEVSFNRLNPAGASKDSRHLMSASIYAVYHPFVVVLSSSSWYSEGRCRFITAHRRFIVATSESFFLRAEGLSFLTTGLR